MADGKQAITEEEDISAITITDLKIRSKQSMTKNGHGSGQAAKREEEGSIH